MDDKRFWDIVAFACKPDADEVEWEAEVATALTHLPHEDIVRFDRWFYEKAAALYTRDHWGVAHLVNGGASDDGFYYFRCWVVAQGRAVYEAALADPDSLAGVVDPGVLHHLSGSLAEGRTAWKRLRLDPNEYDRIRASLGDHVQPELAGDDWDFGNADEVRRRLPRLAVVYLD